jgi:hypothetical protein
MSLSVVPLNLSKHGRQSVPVADATEWVELVTDPKIAESAADLLKPSGISRAGQRIADLVRGGTLLQICLRYQVGQAITTALIVRLVGLTAAGIPQLLADGDDATSWTFDDTAATDLQDADGNAYTPNIEVDAQNCAQAMCLVSTAMVGGGTTGTLPAIMARLK